MKTGSYTYTPTSKFTGGGQLTPGLQSAATGITGTLTLDGGVSFLLSGSCTTTAAGLAIVTSNGSRVIAASVYLVGTYNLAPGSELALDPAYLSTPNLVLPGVTTLNNSGTINWNGTGKIYDGSTDGVTGTINNLQGGIFNATPSSADNHLDVHFSNAGTVNIGTPTSISTLNSDYDFTQTATGVLNIKVGGATSYDALTAQATTLGGTLNVSLINGYKPAPDVSLPVINGSIQGQFATVNGPFKATYSAAMVTLTPQPLAPTLTTFTPDSGLVGATVTITGTGFTGTTSVKFNTTNAPTFMVVSATQIKATIPLGATSGVISVVTPGGTVSSGSAFTVLVPPTISSFTPSSGPVGTVVAITGTGLSGATVTFGTKAATVDTLLSTDAKLVFTVPVGAVTGSCKVTTPGGSATSKTSFTVTMGDGISGHVLASDGKTSLKGVRVFLVKNGDLAALLSSAASPDLVSVTTDATGAYHLPGQAAGTYIITPLAPGTAFTSTHGAAPVTLPISGATTLDFTAGTTDSTAPLVTVANPSATGHGPVTAVTGTIADKESGPLAVVVGLYRIVNGVSDGIYDWRAQTFVAANSQDPGVFKTMPTSGPNWTLALPTLAPGTYRLSVTGINHAFRAGTGGTASGLPITREFTLTGGGSATDSAPPTATLTRVNGLGLNTVISGGSALTVSSLLEVEGTATDNKGGTGIAKVNLYIFRNIKTVIASVSYSAEFWNGASWVSVTVSPLTRLSSIPFLSTTLGTTTGGITNWSRTGGLPQDNGAYNISALAYDKAGNSRDYLSIFTTVRTITVKAAPKSVGVALSNASAQVSTSSITLKFLAVLDADGASDASTYSVTVNGVVVVVESAGYNAATHTVTLTLPEGALHGGAAVTVQRSGLTTSLTAR